MSLEHYVSFLTVVSMALLVFQARRRRAHAIGEADADRSLWAGLAASLFDAADSPPVSRVEIAVAALAGKLGMHGGIVSASRGQDCVILASVGAGPELGVGMKVPSDSLFCGSLSADSGVLAIEYASLSEWRAHRALRERGWESYIGVSGARTGGTGLMIGLFATSPRSSLFTRQEKLLLEQLVPWILEILKDHDLDDAFAVPPGLRASTPELSTRPDA